jgi:hypothetical protein
MTVFRWQSQVAESSTVRINVNSFRDPDTGIVGYVHRIVSVTGPLRTCLRDFMRTSKSTIRKLNPLANRSRALLDSTGTAIRNGYQERLSGTAIRNGSGSVGFE